MIHALAVTPKQIARMKTGRVESRPEDYAMLVSRIEIQAGVARRRAEALRDERALERIKNPTDKDDMTDAIWLVACIAEQAAHIENRMAQAQEHAALDAELDARQ